VPIGSPDRPVVYVSWFDAARFCNWIHNGQPSGSQAAGSTETGAYTFTNNPAWEASGDFKKNLNAKCWIPTENEWFKAAYYDPQANGGQGAYWPIPSRGYSGAGNDVNTPGAENYYYINLIYANQFGGFLTDVGAYGDDSRSAYGLNDMGGNVMEWNEQCISSQNVAGIVRGVRGGCWRFSDPGYSGSRPAVYFPFGSSDYIGFRIAGPPRAELTVRNQDGNQMTSGESLTGFSEFVPARKIAIVNTGIEELTGLSAKVEGQNADDFPIIFAASESIAPGSSAELEIRFSATGPGYRSATVLIASTMISGNPFAIRLEGKTPTQSEAWRYTNFGSMENTGLASDSSDPDGDGIANLIEFATGSDPKQPSHDPGDIVKNGSVLEYRYWRSKLAASELTFVREFAASPSGPWQQTGGTSETIISDDGVRQRVLVTTPASSAIERRFVRLRVTRR
jgi:hypothetical protein